MKTLSPLSTRDARSPQAAFTLVDLLAILAVLTFLALMLLPARADSRTRSQGVRCLDNLRQMMNAVMLYTHDNHDLLPPNPDSASAPAGHAWCSGNAGPSGATEFNPDILASRNQSLLVSYIQTNVSLFRCTADRRTGLYQGTDPKKLGTKVPAARTISMNHGVGTICPGYDSASVHSGIPTLSVNGPWFNAAHSHRRNSPYRTYGRVSEMIAPTPSRLLVLTEEHPMSINDGTFAVSMSVAEWIDFPNTLHGGAGVVAFADSHVELHKWADPGTSLTGTAPSIRSVGSTNPDWLWLTDRITARAQ